MLWKKPATEATVVKIQKQESKKLEEMFLLLVLCDSF